MENKRDELLMALLECNEVELSMLIDNISYDFGEVLDGWIPTGNMLSKIMQGVFMHGFSEIYGAVNSRVHELKVLSEVKALSDAEKDELEKLLLLDSDKDFEGYFHGFGRAKVWCKSNADIYQTYLQDALDDFYENTGFEIKIGESDD